MNPLLRRTAWHVPRQLDTARMRAAAAHFVGRHDFQSFAANPGYSRESTLRTLFKCAIQRQGSLLTVRIEGDGFLYRMCRGIAGTLVQVGLGKFEPSEIPRILRERNRSLAGVSAPAHGLVLWKVSYGKQKPRKATPSKRLDEGTESHSE
jgi:tRNA pseudouridine38-40 synthase